MTRRQAKSRKQREQRQWRLPAVPVARLAQVTLAVSIVVLSYHFSSVLLDQPIHAITVEGPFQRVSALQIEEAISDELRHGFLSADLNGFALTLGPNGFFESGFLGSATMVPYRERAA